jgi:hypothetical protein
LFPLLPHIFIQWCFTAYVKKITSTTFSYNSHPPPPPFRAAQENI